LSLLAFGSRALLDFYENHEGSGSMPIEQLGWKDILEPIATIFATSFALGVGVWQYRRTALEDFAKPLREAQLRTYQKAAAAAGSLATLPTGTEGWEAARNEFLQLYYGQLTMFEDFDHEPGAKYVTVERAMIALKHCLDNEHWTELRSLALGLGHTCRHSLGKVWGYNLPQLRGDYGSSVLGYEEKFMNAE
jgi:hypothetical protein